MEGGQLDGKKKVRSSGSEGKGQWVVLYWKPVTSGVLQGPVLFDIFLGDLGEEMECVLIKCAGDAKAGGAVDKLEDRAAVQRELDWEEWPDGKSKIQQGQMQGNSTS